MSGWATRVLPGERLTQEEAAALRAALPALPAKRRRALFALLPRGAARIRDLDWELNPADNYTERRMWITGEVAEPDSLDMMCERVHGRRVRVLDIGANCGAFALPLARAAGEGSVVHAFEPNPIMVLRLHRNVALNGLRGPVAVHALALGDRAGTAVLTVPERNAGLGSVMDGGQGCLAMPVPIVPVRPYLILGEAEATLLKIDVEGAEAAVLVPLLDDAVPEAELPEAMMIETAHSDRWPPELVARIAARGYVPRWTGEGNTFYVRGA